MIALPFVALFAGLLLYAAWSDLTSFTIPNWVSIALAASFPVAALAHGMPVATIGLHVLFGAGVLAVGFFLFAANVFGGGDAKLLAATAMWTGFAGFTPFIIWTVIAGGALALAILVARRLLTRPEAAPSFLRRLLDPKGGVPYGIAIMTGGLLAIPSIPLGFAALTIL